MRFPPHIPSLQVPLPALGALALGLILVGATAAPASAADESEDGAPAAAVSTVSTSDGAEEEEESLPLTLSLGVDVGVGLGSFVQHELQQQTQVVTVFVPTASYKLTDEIALTGSVALYWYQIMDFGTPYENDKLLWTDAYLNVGHSSIWADEDLGLTLSGAFRVYAPTSKASQFQSRYLTVRPGLTMGWKAGDFTLSAIALFAKYLFSSSNPQLDCEGFEDSTQCREGRGPDVAGGFTSEKKGGEVFLPSYGVNSFYATWGLSAGYEIVEGLSASASATVYNIFGVSKVDVDELSSPNARVGRHQLDRFITSIALSYTVNANLTVGTDLTTDTFRPFGSAGDDLVVLDFERAPDNITSLTFSLKGTL